MFLFLPQPSFSHLLQIQLLDASFCYSCLTLCNNMPLSSLQLQYLQFQLILAILGLTEVLRRFFVKTEVPEFQMMMLISFLALLGNAACLYLLQKSKSKEAHIQASVIFTNNDVMINLGVIIAGVLVYFTHSTMPDLVIGTLIFILVTRGAFSILKLSK